MCQARTCGRVRARARVQVIQNMVVLRFTTLSARDRHWRNPRKKNYRERSNIKARVSVHWRAQCHAKWPRRGRAFQHSSGIQPKSADSRRPLLTTKPLVCINNRKKTVHDSLYFANCNRFFGNRTVVLWFFKLNIKARHEIWEFLIANLLIDASYRIWHRLELKYFHFTQVLLNAHQLTSSSSLTLKKWELRTWNLG